MTASHQQLVENFDRYTTEHLLERLVGGGLSEEAMSALEQVLAEREVTPQARSQIEARVQEQISFEGQKASRLARLVAQIADGVIAVAVLFTGSALSSVTSPAAEVVAMLLMLTYLLFADGLPNGQSLGKRLVGIAVVGANSRQPCTYFQSFGRNVAAVLGILDWAFIFGSKRQRLGDILARTYVVNVVAQPDGADAQRSSV